MPRKKDAPRLLVRPRYENDRRAIILVRVSEDRERGHERQSEHDQLGKVRHMIEAKGLTEVGVYQEIGVSGDADRTAVKEAVVRIKRGEAAWLVVYAVDRLGRNFLDVVNTMEDVADAGGCLLVVEPTIDTSTGPGRLILIILGELARAERDRITRNWDTAQTGSWERGKYPGDLPCGLRNPWTASDVKRYRQGLATPPDDVEDPTKPEVEELPGHPVPQHVPHEVEAIREVANALVDDGISWSAAAELLTARLGRGGRRRAAKHGGGWVEAWSGRGVKAMFSSRLLVGEVAFGDFPPVPDAFKPVISHSQFEAINAPDRTWQPRNTEAKNIGTGMLRCAGCRTCLTYVTGGKGYSYISCKNKRCPNRVKSLKPAEVEPLLLDLAFGAYRKQMAAARARGSERVGRSLVDVESDIAAVRKRSVKFGELLADDPEDEGLLAGKAKLKAELAALEAERRGLAATDDSERHEAFSYLPLFKSLPPAKQIRYIRAVLGVVFVEASTGRMYAFEPGEYTEPLPGKGRSVPLRSFVLADDAPVEVGALLAA